MRPLQIRILRSGYVVGKKQMSTVVALDAELARLDPKEVHVVPDKEVCYRSTASPSDSLAMFGAICDRWGVKWALPGKVLVPTRKDVAILLAAQRCC
jgi:hypothetical protein